MLIFVEETKHRCCDYFLEDCQMLCLRHTTAQARFSRI